MRTPEEVAREIRRLTWDVLGNDGLVEEDGPALADLIRARDAEVAEQVRAETLADVGDHSNRQAEAYRELADKYGGYYQGIRSAWQELDRWVNVQEPAGGVEP